MNHAIPRSRSISQILSAAGYPSAGVRQRGCGFIVPPDAHGYGTAEMVCGPWPGSDHRWRGVTISWYGDSEPPFAQLAELLQARGYEVSEADRRSLMTGRPAMTVWLPGADVEDEPSYDAVATT
jgi:hypothetical protein